MIEGAFLAKCVVAALDKKATFFELEGIESGDVKGLGSIQLRNKDDFSPLLRRIERVRVVRRGPHTAVGQVAFRRG